MSDSHEDEMTRLLERLGEIKLSAEETLKSLEKVRHALGQTPVAASPAKRKSLRWALIAATLPLLGLGALSAWLWLSHAAVHGATFAEVQDAVKNSPCLSYRVTTKFSDQLVNREWHEVHVERHRVRAPSLVRMEREDGSYLVVDYAQGRTLSVNPNKREATLREGIELPGEQCLDRDFMVMLNELAPRLLPGTEIDGKEMIGFSVPIKAWVGASGGKELKVWADTRTRLPVRVGFQFATIKGGNYEWVADDFLFGPEKQANALPALQSELASLRPEEELKMQRELDIIQADLNRKELSRIEWQERQQSIQKATQKNQGPASKFIVTDQMVENIVLKDAEIRTKLFELGRADEYMAKLRLISPMPESLPEYDEYVQIKRTYMQQIEERKKLLRPQIRKRLESLPMTFPEFDADDLEGSIAAGAAEQTIRTLRDKKNKLQAELSRLAEARRQKETRLIEAIDKAKAELANPFSLEPPAGYKLKVEGVPSKK